MNLNELKKYFLILLSLLIMFSGFFQVQTHAHPLPLGVNHDTFFTRKDDFFILSYSLKMFYQDIDFFRDQIDANKDKKITEDEANSWGEILSPKVYLTINDQKENISKTLFYSDFNNLQDTLYVTVNFDLFFDQIEQISLPASLKIHNSYRIKSGDLQDWNFAFDTNSLNLENVNFLDQQNLESNLVSFVNNSESQTQSQPAQSFSTNSIASDFSGRIIKLLSDENYSAGTILTLLLIAFVFGMAHTLTPGHGKAIIGSYMAAIKGNLGDAIIMSVSTVVSHTGVVITLAFLFYFLRESLQFVIPFLNINITIPSLNIRQFVPYISLFSGVSVIIIGLWLFYKRLNEFINKKVNQKLNPQLAGFDSETINEDVKGFHAHNHENQSHTHSHENENQSHTHLHDNLASHGHSHNHKEHSYTHHDVNDQTHQNAHSGDHGHDHGHTHYVPTKRLTPKESIILGLSTGLNPCIDAIAILILSIRLQQNFLGIVIILVFSLGMGITLTAIGYGVGKGINFGSKNIKNGEQILDYLPMVSSLLIAITGLFLII